MKSALSLVFIFFVLVGFSQPIWQPTGHTLPTGDKYIFTVGDDSYIIYGTTFKKKNFGTGVLTDLASFTGGALGYTAIQHYVHNDFIYIFKRYDSQSVLAKYSMLTNTWTLLTPAGLIDALNINSFMFGTPSALYICTETSTMMERFDFESETWSNNLTRPEINQFSCAYSKNGVGRVVYTNGTVMEYNEQANTWSQLYTGLQVLGDSQPTSSIQSRLCYDEWVFYPYDGLRLVNLQTGTRMIVPPARLFIYNGEIHGEISGNVVKLELCALQTNIEIYTEGAHYRNTELVPKLQVAYEPPAVVFPSDHTWFLDGEPVAFGQYNPIWLGQNHVGEEHQFISKIRLGECSFYDTSYIQLRSGYWSPITGLPFHASDRGYAVGFGADNYAYMGLGETNGNLRLKDMWRMDYHSKEIVQIADFPGTPRSRSSYVTYDNAGYIVGGLPNEISSEFWKFDPQTESWTQLQNLPEVAISEGTAFVLNDKLYVGPSVAGQFCIYDFLAQSWSLGPVITGINGFVDVQSFVINNQGYVIVYSFNTRKLYKLETTGFTLINPNFIPQLTFPSIWVTTLNNDNVLISGRLIDDTSWSTEYLYYPETNYLTDGPKSHVSSSATGEWLRTKTTVFSHGSKRYVAFGYNNNHPNLSEQPHRDVAEKYGRFIFEFSPDGCGGAVLQKVVRGVTAVNSAVFLRPSSLPAFGSNSTWSFTIGQSEGLTSPMVYDANTTYGLYLRNYNGCVDTFRFDIKTICNVETTQANAANADIALPQRYFPATWTIGNDFYVGLGMYGTTPRTDLWKYNGDTDTWVQLAHFPGIGRSEPAHFRIGQKLYIVGGSNAIETMSHASNTRYSDTWVYDIESNQWTELAPFPQGVFSGAFAFVYNGIAYVGGGKRGTGLGTFSNYMSSYNPETNTWTQLANYAAPASNQGVKNAYAVLKGDTALIMGGNVLSSSCGSCYSPNLKIYGYDIPNNSWLVYGGGHNYSTFQEPNVSDVSAGVYAAVVKDNIVYWLKQKSNIWAYDTESKNFADLGPYAEGVNCTPSMPSSQCETIVAGSGSESTFYLLTRNYNPSGTNFPTHRLRRIDLNELICSNPAFTTVYIQSQDSAICYFDSTTITLQNGYPNLVIVWKRNGEILQGETSSTLVVNEAGIYQATYLHNGEYLETNSVEITASTNCSCTGDLNQDGVINTADIQILISEFGCTSNCLSDLNGDSFVGVADLLILNGLLGQACD